ncbi:MAG: TrkA family potassium uptake protein [Myxococcales bacterium]|nr:TrkA family potassium uptake protein [Myxococcales bacterium]
MRVVFVGASDVTVEAAKLLIEHRHDVVIVETNRERIDELSGVLDCSFLNGDGSRPPILSEANPKSCDVLACLTNNDQANIIASLVGRSLGFPQVVTRIQDPEFEAICRELGLEHTIVPSRTIGRAVADLVGGIEVPELSTAVRGEARFFEFVVGDATAVPVEELGLPEAARVICYYRDKEFRLAEPTTKLAKGDEVVILTHADHLAALKETYGPKAPAPSKPEDTAGGEEPSAK